MIRRGVEGMSARVGIDVGGTFTDAVLLRDNRIEAAAKVPTDTNDLLATILQAIDALNLNNRKGLERITVSTTLVTNAILQKRLPDAQLLLYPGKGLRLDALKWPVPYQTLTGEIDYRGREVQPPDELEWRRLVQQWKNAASGPERLAIVGKFSHRNHSHERELARYVKQAWPNIQLALGHQWGKANFYRRSLTTYLDLTSAELLERFAAGLSDAVAARGLEAPIFVLKADAGVLPLDKVRPVESVYSGPAASVLGALAQASDLTSFVIVDIGGTTTDIGFVLAGSPLLSSRGAKIGSFATLVRTLAVRSVAAGGDSTVVRSFAGTLTLANYRSGPAFCLGGPAPTPTDAMRYLGLVAYGDQDLATKALASLLPAEDRTAENLRHTAQTILQILVERIAAAMAELHQEWEEEPAYKVWGVLHPHEAANPAIWVSGGAAEGLAQALQERLQAKVYVGKYPGVSNAIGAAMAKPTFSCTLHLDTVLRCYRIEETGEQGEWKGTKRLHKEVDAFLESIARREAEAKGIVSDELQLEKEAYDIFPVVQDFATAGQIVRGAIHVTPGVTGRVIE